MNRHPDEKTIFILSLVSILAPPVAWISFFMSRKLLRESRLQGFDTVRPRAALAISVAVMVVQVLAIILSVFLAIAIYSSFYAY